MGTAKHPAPHPTPPPWRPVPAALTGVPPRPRVPPRPGGALSATSARWDAANLRAVHLPGLTPPLRPPRPQRAPALYFIRQSAACGACFDENVFHKLKTGLRHCRVRSHGPPVSLAVSGGASSLYVATVAHFLSEALQAASLSPCDPRALLHGFHAARVGVGRARFIVDVRLPCLAAHLSSRNPHVRSASGPFAAARPPRETSFTWTRLPSPEPCPPSPTASRRGTVWMVRQRARAGKPPLFANAPSQPSSAHARTSLTPPTASRSSWCSTSSPGSPLSFRRTPLAPPHALPRWTPPTQKASARDSATSSPPSGAPHPGCTRAPGGHCHCLPLPDACRTRPDARHELLRSLRLRLLRAVASQLGTATVLLGTSADRCATSVRIGRAAPSPGVGDTHTLLTHTHPPSSPRPDAGLRLLRPRRVPGLRNGVP